MRPCLKKKLNQNNKLIKTLSFQNFIFVTCLETIITLDLELASGGYKERLKVVQSPDLAGSWGSHRSPACISVSSGQLTPVLESVSQSEGGQSEHVSLPPQSFPYLDPRITTATGGIWGSPGEESPDSGDHAQSGTIYTQAKLCFPCN